MRRDTCAQKRTLLLGEYLSGNLLLNLPHRQLVWTIPKILRSFLRHDRNLFADIGRLIFDILTSYFSQAAGRPIRGAMVSSHQTFGSFAVWNPHWHTIVLEGGFDRYEGTAESAFRTDAAFLAPLRVFHRQRNSYL